VEKEDFISRIMKKMSPSSNRDVHGNVSRLIGELIFAFQDDLSSSSQDRSNDADPFLNALRRCVQCSMGLSLALIHLDHILF